MAGRDVTVQTTDASAFQLLIRDHNCDIEFAVRADRLLIG